MAMHGMTFQPEIASEIIAQVRSGDYQRFLAIQLAPREKRAALYALTAFYCEIAAIVGKVSEPMMGHIRLAWWREALAEMATGAPPRQHPVTLVLAPVLADIPSLANDLNAILDARGAALEDQVVADEPAWLAYLDGTVGALHRAWAWVLDAKAAQRQRDAIAQQARICATIAVMRDIPHMAGRGKLPLPAQLLAAHGLSSLNASDALNTMVISQVAPLVAKERHVRLGRALRPLDGVMAIHRYAGNRLLKARGSPYHSKYSRLGNVLAVVYFTYL